MTAVLSAKKLKKVFTQPKEQTLFDHLSLDVGKGEAIAIMGRSGEGKSTLLHLLGTLDNPTEGELYILGEKVSSFNRNTIRLKRLGFVFQSFHLLEDFTVLENVLMPAQIARKQSRERALALLDQVGLKGKEKQIAKQLSGGEKQRVAIARALCNDPDILLADEPSGNLDSQTAKGIHDLLLHFCKKEGKTLIVVTHNEELASLCDQIYLLKNGTLCKT